DALVGRRLVVRRVAELEDAVEAQRDVGGHLDGRLFAEDAGAHRGLTQPRDELVERQPRERRVRGAAVQRMERLEPEQETDRAAGDLRPERDVVVDRLTGEVEQSL